MPGVLSTWNYRSVWLFLVSLLYLLFIFQEACKVMEIHDFFLIAVGDQDQIEVSAGGNHLVERTEFLEAQRALVLVCVCFLQILTQVFSEPEISVSVCVWCEITTLPKKICTTMHHIHLRDISLSSPNMMELVHRDCSHQDGRIVSGWAKAVQLKPSVQQWPYGLPVSLSCQNTVYTFVWWLRLHLFRLLRLLWEWCEE